MTKTVQISASEFKARIARFKDLSPNVKEYAQKTGIHEDAYRYVAVEEIFYLLGASNPTVPAATAPAIEGPKGAAVYIVGTPPGDGPTLHAHMRTWETFVVLSGRYEFAAGDYGQYTVVLEPFDMFSCPPGVSRRFTNVSDQPANLLVVIQGQTEALDDIALAPEYGDAVVMRWGEAAKAGLERVGMAFDIEKVEPKETLAL
jgi:uncharacterized RmlC-like cupin family protein